MCHSIVTYALMIIVGTLIASYMLGFNDFTYNQKVDEKVDPMDSPFCEDEDMPNNIFNEILSDDEIKRLDPFRIKQYMMSTLISMDTNKNGFIEKHELSEKLLETYKKLSIKGADLEFQRCDTNINGYITWQEYVDEIYAFRNDIEENEKNEEKYIFSASDIDKDGQLSKIEFRYFYTPENYPHMIPVVMNGAVNRLDTDKDGKITVYDFLQDKNINKQLEQKKHIEFTDELDVNRNGILEEDEIFNWALPNKKNQAENEALNLIFYSDNNKDGMLSFDEILENYLAFLSPESEGYYIFKEEL